MNEEIIQFGDNENLIGILSKPDEIQIDKPIFIFVNSGLLHRVGPFRIYVATSRELVKSNFASLRMDLSGKGDSLPKQNSLNLKDNINQDIVDAMDHLQAKLGVKQFVICGICTGADNAYEISFNDERVKGIVPIDGYAYPTSTFHIKKLSSRLTSKSSWLNLLGKVLPLNRNKSQKRLDKSSVSSDYRMIFPEKAIFKQRLASTLENGTKLLVIFTGGWYMFYNHKNQFKDSIQELYSEDKIQVEYNQKSDHTFILQKDKEWLISTVVDWAKVNF